MASKEINLVPDKVKMTPDQVRSRSRIKKTTTLILVVVVFVLLVVFGTSVYVNQQIAATDAGIETERAQIKTLEKNEGTYLLLKQKATALRNILSSRYNYVDVFNFFKEMESKGGTIQSLQLSENGEVVASLTIPDSGALDTYINELLAVAEKRFGKIEMQGVQFNPVGSFTVTFAISFVSKEPT